MTVARALLLTIFMLLAACGAQAPAGPANAGPAKAPIPTPAEVHGPLVSTLAGKAGPVFVRFLANAHSGTVDDVEVVTADVTCSDRHAREDEVHLGFHATAGPSGPSN